VVFPVVVVPAAPAAILLSLPHCPNGSYVTWTRFINIRPRAGASVVFLQLGSARAEGCVALLVSQPWHRSARPGAPWRRNPHADSADTCGNQAISVSLGRSVVLTMGRLVASNCFASGPASGLLPTAQSVGASGHTDDSTWASLSRTAKESKAFLCI